MKPHFKKQIEFGLGFKVPVRDLNGTPDDGIDGQYSEKGTTDGPLIEVDFSEPLWVSIDAYAHEVLHAAIDFHRHAKQMADTLKEEADETKRELADD